jgi:ribosomal protein S18 acetylase RimI-like enzyme
MQTVSSIDIILNSIKKVKQNNIGYLTNFFLDIPKMQLWIFLKIIEYEEIGKTIFFCRINKGFKNIYFITTENSALSQDVRLLCHKYSDDLFVIDLIGQFPYVFDLKNVLLEKGFYQYTSLVRMSKTISSQYLEEKERNCISYADISRGEDINGLLQKYFDPYAEQLPLIDEIHNWANNNQIIIYSEDYQTIQGFIIFELIGSTSYLRYWFVSPDHREKKIGSTLFRKYIKESANTVRQLFWVIESNKNAIKRYEHYGFNKEKLFDNIMINKDICYERKSNTYIDRNPA